MGSIKDGFTTILIKNEQRDRINFLKMHPNQANYEIIEDLLNGLPGGTRGRNSINTNY